MGERIHEYSLTILERHLDTFGHVNNATYLQLLEEARWDWITRGGYGLAEVKKRAQGPTILECNLKFLKELTNREHITIRSWGESYVGKIALVRQDILRKDGEQCLLAEFSIGLFDVQARKLIEPTDEWLACVGWSRAEWQPKA